MHSIIHDQLADSELVTSPDDGTPGDDKIKGTASDDYLLGEDGNDTISGLAGYDTIDGGAGDDIIDGGAGGDYLSSYDVGSDTLLGGGGNDVINLARQEYYSPETADHVLIDGGAGDDDVTLDAFAYNDPIYALEATVAGGDGDDTIRVLHGEHVTVDAGAGDDTVQSYVGQDTVITLGEGSDTLVLDDKVGDLALVVTDFQAGDGGDQIHLRSYLEHVISGWSEDNPFGDGHLRLVQDGADTVVQLDIDGGGDSWSDLIVLRGVDATALTAFNLDSFPPDGSPVPGEAITGDGDDNEITGTIGNDTIHGAGGGDTIDSGVGNDLVYGDDGNDFLTGERGGDTLYGGAGDDYIFAVDRSGAYGGAGGDYIEWTTNADPDGIATLSGGDGDDQIHADTTHAERASLQIAGGDGDDRFEILGQGKVSANGGAGADVFNLYGVGGETSLTLGAGADVVAIWEDAGSGAIGVTITDFEAGSGGDRLDLTDFMTSNFLDWDHSTNPFAEGYLRLVARGGSTLLQYSPGADGSWNDLFLLKGVAPGDLTQENLGGFPGDGSEPTGLLISGDKLANEIEGDYGPDTLLGGGGDDSLIGAAGNDSLVGGAGADWLYGGLGSDFLSGGAGNDSLYEYTPPNGDDTLLGGGGDDSLQVNRTDFGPAKESHILVDGGVGDDVLNIGGDGGDAQFVVAIGGDGDDQISVNSMAGATITGGEGKDIITLSGPTLGARADGGAGNDTFLLNDGGTDIRLTLGDGADKVQFASYFYFTGNTIRVTDFGATDSLQIANFVAWTLGGTSDPFGDGFMRLVQEGEDTLVQVDRYHSGNWANLIELDGVQADGLTRQQLGGYKPGPVWQVGGDGHDKLTASGDLTHLDGGGGGDVLIGSDASDVLIGGAGSDLLTGGAGDDVFKYLSQYDSSPAAHDTITDLGGGDVIDLSAIDADPYFHDGDQAFTLIAKFDGTAGELTVTYRPGADVTVIAGDTDGDGQANFELVVQGDHHQFANFVL